jgi:hypothetical protein
VKYEWNGDSRKRILGRTAQYLHNQGAIDGDGFLLRFISKIAIYVEQKGEFPDDNEIKGLFKDLKTSFFKSNRTITKDDFAFWIAKTLDSEKTGAIYPVQAQDRIVSPIAQRITIDDIDSFQSVRQTTARSISSYVPLNISESVIKQNIADILAELFVHKDWAGETADLFTSQIMYQGKRLLAAGFLLKGPAVKGTLTIKYLGKNGDQIVRLTSVSLDLYAVQFVGPIHQAVIDHLDAHVLKAAQKAGKNRLYCIIDGLDTARLLKAYQKL